MGAANDISCKLSEMLCNIQELKHRSTHMRTAFQIAADIPGAIRYNEQYGFLGVQCICLIPGAYCESPNL